jgi:hypothetical protein
LHPSLVVPLDLPEVEHLAQDFAAHTSLLDPCSHLSHLPSVTVMTSMLNQVGDLDHASEETGFDAELSMAFGDLFL